MMFSKEDKAYAKGYLEGGRDALLQLEDLFEGIRQTDVWDDFWGEDKPEDD